MEFGTWIRDNESLGKIFRNRQIKKRIIFHGIWHVDWDKIKISIIIFERNLKINYV